MIHWPDVEHFNPSEFASPDDVFSANRMSGRVVFALVALRKLVGRPFIINSGYRTPAHNAKVGGAPHSAHLEGLAADISTRKWSKTEKRDFLVYARILGFTGIGVAPTFIHVDMKPRKAAWIYKNGGQEPIPIGKEVEYA